MTRKQLSRRDFMSSSALVSVGFMVAGTSVLAACGEAGDGQTAMSAGAPEEVFRQFAKRLYPHRQVDAAVYGEVVDGLLTDPGAGPGIRVALEDGIAALDQDADGSWTALSAEEQIARMRQVEAEPFFLALQAPFRANFYDNPAVWKVVGYDGPSAQFGGFINRGFDDIDWLPEVEE